jgi:RNA polymerase sigma-70 factor (ECF subfamily)
VEGHSVDSDNRATRRLPAPQEEVALVSRVAEGDTRAFDDLFRCYVPRLVRFLGRTTRVPHLIDEIVNDTMLIVWRKAGTFNGCSRVSTWILGIASRRRLKALERMEKGVGAAVVDDIASPAEAGPEEQHVRQDELRRCSAAIEALPPEQRQVVILTYFEGLSYQEIARIAGCPVNTVKTRMFHARRRLKALLSERRSAA